MELSIVKEQDLPLLGRRDVVARVAFQGATPGRAKLRAALAKQFSTKDDLIMVRRIGTVFGDQVSLVEASVYRDDASLVAFEQAHIRKRHGAEAAPAAGGA